MIKRIGLASRYGTAGKPRRHGRRAICPIASVGLTALWIYDGNDKQNNGFRMRDPAPEAAFPLLPTVDCTQCSAGIGSALR